MPRLDGVDLSYWNGFVRWSEVAATGITWAATRIWDRQHGPAVDNQFVRNRLGMTAIGLPIRLLYWFLEPARSVADQAAQCVQIVGPLAVGEGIMLDAESTTTESQAFVFCHLVEGYTRRPVAVYTSDWVDGGNTWRSPRIFDGTRPRIFAAPTTQRDAENRARPHRWDVWQWSFTGTVPGIDSATDLDQVDRPEAFAACCGYSHGLTVEDRAWLDERFAALTGA